MVTLDNLTSKEWADLVAHPNTTRGDAMVAFCAGEPLDFNPYDMSHPKYQWWAEGYEMAKADRGCWERRERNSKFRKDNT